MICDRTIENVILQRAKSYLAVAVMEPRQSGKTTLVRKLFRDRPYISFEAPDMRELLRVQDLASYERFIRFCSNRIGWRQPYKLEAP